MKFSSLPVLGLIVAVHFGCDNDPAEGKARAKVAAATPAATATATAAATATRYVFSNEDSRLDWVGAKVTRKHEGAFQKFEGVIQLPEAKPEAGRVEVTIQTASITADVEKLTGHLKSADFLDVEKFPQATFSSTRIEQGGEGSATHTITGNLQLHGVTKTITFPATIRTSGDSVTANAEFAIDRKDFEIVYPGMPDDLIKDDVLIRLSVKAAPDAA